MDDYQPDPRNAQRDERVLLAAVALARSVGYRRVTRQAIADHAGLAAGSVSNYGRTRMTNGDHASSRAMDDVRTAVLQWAVDNGDLHLVAQGLADRHPAVLAAPEALRVAAIASVS